MHARLGLTGLLQVSLRLMDLYADDMMELSLAVLQQHLLVWACLDVLDQLTQAILLVHKKLKEQRTYSRTIFDFLLQPAIFGSLDTGDQQLIMTDLDIFRSVRHFSRINAIILSTV
jgi:hypothetical protein